MIQSYCFNGCKSRVNMTDVVNNGKMSRLSELGNGSKQVYIEIGQL